MLFYNVMVTYITLFSKIIFRSIMTNAVHFKKSQKFIESKYISINPIFALTSLEIVRTRYRYYACHNREQASNWRCYNYR